MLVELIVLFVSLGIGLAISVPLTGALVRLRANFNPKSIQLDVEGSDVQCHTGPAATSLFGMLRRVKRIEGWAGLYKGFMPTMLATVSLSAFISITLGISPIQYKSKVPNIGILGLLASTVIALSLSLPLDVIAYRAITTQYRLPYLDTCYSLRVLLTPTERRRPWIIYLTPGLFAARFIQTAYKVILLGAVRQALFPSEIDVNNIDKELLIKLCIMIGISVASTVILCPLDVIASKLAIQRKHAAPEYNSVDQEVVGDAVVGQEYAEYSGADEDVIGLRHEMDPYLGLSDCVKKIIREEGWKALYRAWWLTAIAGIFHA